MYQSSPQMVADIKRREGFSLAVYRDSNGFPTQGYGQHSGVAFGDPDITRDTALVWLNKSLGIAYVGAVDTFPNLDNLDIVRKEALIDLVYNMGADKLNIFTPFIDAVNQEDWSEAAFHLIVNTHNHINPYTLQVQSRAVDNAIRIATGTIPREFRV